MYVWLLFLYSRWEQANDRTLLLEQSVAEAQQIENSFKEFQEWLEGLDAQLTARVCNDTDANDIPHDVQVPVPSYLSKLYYVRLRIYV